MTEILSKQDIAELIENRLLQLDPDVYQFRHQELSGGFIRYTIKKGDEVFALITIGPLRRAGPSSPADNFGFEVNNSMLAEWQPIHDEPMADIESRMNEKTSAALAELGKNAEQTKPNGAGQPETIRVVNQSLIKPVDLSNRRKVLIGLLLIISIAMVLFAITIPVVSGFFPYQFAQGLFFFGLAMFAATTILAAWNNILSLVEKIFSGNKKWRDD